VDAASRRSLLGFETLAPQGAAALRQMPTAAALLCVVQLSSERPGSVAAQAFVAEDERSGLEGRSSPHRGGAILLDEVDRRGVVVVASRIRRRER
jgi:hypothetical protein